MCVCLCVYVCVCVYAHVHYVLHVRLLIICAVEVQASRVEEPLLGSKYIPVCDIEVINDYVSTFFMYVIALCDILE